MAKLRIVLWVMVALAAVGAISLVLQSSKDGQSSEMPLATIGGPFTLTGGDGQPFASNRLNGKPAAIFFGFTHCPDVCPTTLARLTKLRKQLGSDDTFSIVFISVDPERDGPAEVGRYAEMFGSPVIGLTGSPGQISQVKKQFGIFSQKVPDGAGSYTVDHTATVLLFGRDGKFDSTIAHEEQDPAALDKLRRITA